MKTKYISSLLLLFLMINFSCKKELEPQESSGTIPTSTPETPSNTAVSAVQSPAAGVNSSTIQPNPNANLSGMNPPHGQAGHRCDIAVGAPLNSPPNKSVPNPAKSNPVANAQAPVISKSNATAVVTQPGMNPPHGQAGHRCDIAVGAPLNSPVNKTNAVPSATNAGSNPTSVPNLLKTDSTGTAPQ
jgi:hypothetical protein